MKLALPILVLITGTFAQNPINLWGEPNPGTAGYRKWCPMPLVYDNGVDGGHKFVYDAWCYPDGVISETTGTFYSIVLDECLANSEGHLWWRKYGNLSSTCFECGLRDPKRENRTSTTEMLHCSCAMPGGTTMMNSIDLFEGIVYDQGKLRCADWVQ